MNIYLILSSKPHNPHYLNRYISFINKCQYQNFTKSEYHENHHICPQAKDMFPEYKSFKDNPWNCIKLSARQHFIAHLLLWKIYKNRSMTMAAYFIKNTGQEKINSRLYEKLKLERSNHLRTYLNDINKGLVNIITDNGIKKISIDEFTTGNYKAQHSNTVLVSDGIKSFRIPINDPRYINKELAGHTKGKTFAVDDQGNKFYVSTNDERLETGELKGNNAGTITITNGIKNRRVSPEAEIPAGWYKGMSKKSPKGSIWINNGISTKMIHDQIPEGWVKGRLLI